MERFLASSEGTLPFSVREDGFARLENAAAALSESHARQKALCREEADRSRELVADISHQLKTPLASLRLFCELDAGAHQAQEFQLMERMETLLSALLRLEKLRAGGYALRMEQCSLRALCQDAWESLSPQYPDKRVTIEGDATLRCDETWLSEALQNCIRNACQHTAPDGCVTLTLSQDAGGATFLCQDDGGGVQESELPRIFERFHSTGGQGVGIGLAIVKAVALAHHGTAQAENARGGLRVTLFFPDYRRQLTKT